MPKRSTSSPSESPRPAAPRHAAAFPAALAWILAAAAAVPVGATEPSLEEKILQSKYPRGDYAVYAGWHDPWDWQFDEHGSFAVPIGGKVRFKWLDWMRVEADVAYYRRGQEPSLVISLYRAPRFDGLMLGGTLQFVPRLSGLLRPYAGGGPIVVSLGNDFLAWRPDVAAVDPTNPDQYALASWSKADVGLQIQAGLDFAVAHRVFPFLEYRHLFGEVTLDDGDVTIGAFPFDPETLYTVPEEGKDPRPHSPHYDWSGPIVSAGLKVRF